MGPYPATDALSIAPPFRDTLTGQIVNSPRCYNENACDPFLSFIEAPPWLATPRIGDH